MSAIPTEGSDEGRPLDLLLAAYAAGSVSRQLGALVESHLAMRAENRGFVGALDALGGAELGEGAPTPLRDREALLSAALAKAAPQPLPAPEGVLPRPLRAYLGHGLDAVRWRWLMPGLKEARLADPGVTFLWARGGSRMPAHTHDGLEVTLVISGAFGDSTGHYQRGDIEIGDQDLDHQPIVEKGEDCLCFVVAEGALRLTGRFGRWIDKLKAH